MRYPKHDGQILRELLNRDLDLYSTNVFLRWLTDMPGFIGRQSLYARDLRMHQPHVSRAFKSLVTKGVLVEKHSIHNGTQRRSTKSYDLADGFKATVGIPQTPKTEEMRLEAEKE
jgi:hypothetical protein